MYDGMNLADMAGEGVEVNKLGRCNFDGIVYKSHAAKKAHHHDVRAGHWRLWIRRYRHRQCDIEISSRMEDHCTRLDASNDVGHEGSLRNWRRHENLNHPSHRRQSETRHNHPYSRHHTIISQQIQKRNERSCLQCKCQWHPEYACRSQRTPRQSLRLDWIMYVRHRRSEVSICEYRRAMADLPYVAYLRRIKSNLDNLRDELYTYPYHRQQQKP